MSKVLSCFSRHFIPFLLIFFYSREPLTKWSRGRLILLGDAAHPMLQYAGQGAAQAMEDAFALVSKYREYGPTKIEKIFREYEKERIPRSARVMQFARDIGTYAHQDGALKASRDLFLKQRESTDYDIIRWLYEGK